MILGVTLSEAKGLKAVQITVTKGFNDLNETHMPTSRHKGK
jgi:hypothetical protein